MQFCSTTLLDQLYVAFSDEPRPVTIDACPCCMDAEAVSKLISTPLRQLAAQDLGKYASSVFLTVGSEADFRYFLPRILEVMAMVPSWWPTPEVVGRAMANIPWEKHTKRQQQALVKYFDGVFEALITSPSPVGYEIDSWLCCSSHVLPGWEAILEHITTKPKALMALYEWHSEPLQKRQLGNGFWDNSPKETVFLQWMMSEQVRAVLMAEWGL